MARFDLSVGVAIDCAASAEQAGAALSQRATGDGGLSPNALYPFAFAIEAPGMPSRSPARFAPAWPHWRRGIQVASAGRS